MSDNDTTVPTITYYKYTTDNKNYIIKKVEKEGTINYLKAEVTDFENKMDGENNITFAKEDADTDFKLPDDFNFDNATTFDVLEDKQEGGRRRRSKSSKKRVKKSRKGGKAKKSKKVRKH